MAEGRFGGSPLSRAQRFVVEVFRRLLLVLLVFPILLGAWTLGIIGLLLIGCSAHSATAFGLLAVPVYFVLLFLAARWRWLDV